MWTWLNSNRFGAATGKLIGNAVAHKRASIALIAASVFPTLGFQPTQTQETFEEKFPQQVVSFKMVRLPDGEVEVDGKKQKIKNLSISETEIPWEIFEIFVLRLDQSAEQQTSSGQSSGQQTTVKPDAITRPSKPYAVIFTGFGHHGYPANCVSVENAKEFCKWLSAKTGRKYRLPSVAEWQYAAKANAAAPSDLNASAWYWDNADDVTHKLGTKKPNAWGLKDMLGNVAEWAIDPKGNPVVCGGSWKDQAKDVTWNSFQASTPKWNEADPQNPKSRWWLANGQFVGLRLVCTP